MAPVGGTMCAESPARNSRPWRIGSGPIIVALFTDYVFGSDAALRYSLASLAGVTAPVSALFFWLGLRHFRRLLGTEEY